MHVYSESIQNFREILFLRGLPVIRLGYDTTFRRSRECFLSIVTHRAVEFEEEPTVPLMMVFHETKSQRVHDAAFYELRLFVPELSKSKNAVFTTDKEMAIVNAIKEYFPDIPLFRCYLHTERDLKRKLRKLGVTKKADLEEFRIDFRSLLNTASKEEYHKKLIPLVVKWVKTCKVYSFFSFETATHVFSFNSCIL